MRFIKNYINNVTLRHELNELTQITFGFDFEHWVTNGYYEGDYIPYSYEENNRLIANVSVNRMDFLQNGQEKHYIQLGTVMTRSEFRTQGYARKLMEKVFEDYVGNCDGIYLFGNLSALEFYDKMGFTRGMQYRYILKNEMKIKLQKKAKVQEETSYFRLVKASDSFHKDKYMEAVRHSAVNAALEQKNKYGLQMFYTSGMEQVYYSPMLDCYIVMEKEELTLYLQSIICTKRIRIEEVLTCLQEEYDKIILGFTPCIEDMFLFVPQIYDGEDDYRLFFYGEQLKEIESKKLYFPVLSHA